MKKVINYITLAATAMFCLVSCFQEKSEIPVYVPATAETNAQVFFKDVPTTQVKLAKESPSLDIIVARSSTGALSVPISAAGDDALTYFTVPESVDFGAEDKEVKLTISVKDVANTPMNEYYPLTISIGDASLATVYGTSSFSFEIGISLPWILFDKGTIFETPYWGEQEEIPIYYQQISENIRYCVVEGCFGHDTGPTYPVQDYTWYWNTETNEVYIPVQFMGYENSNGKTWFGDESSFYNLYWAMKNGAGYAAGAMGPGAGQVEGSDEWFAFCDAFRAQYPEDYYPYYDGAGKFYLADQYIAGYPGDGSVYLGRYTADGWSTGYDMYVCSFAADYTIDLVYDGLLTDKDGDVYATGSVEFVGEDVAKVVVAVVPGNNPNAAVALMLAGEEADNIAVLSASGAYKLPLAELDENYTVVAAPCDAEGEFVWDEALYETFAYMDYSVSISGFESGTNPETGNGFANATINVGSDVEEVKVVLAESVEAALELIEKDDASVVTILRTTELSFVLPGEGSYTICAVSFDSEGNDWGLASKTFEYGPWHIVGTATWTDVFFGPWFGAEALSWDVPVEENDDIAGLYRLVNVYGEAFPYNEAGDWDTSKDYKLVLHAEDPALVYIDPFDTGCNWGYGDFLLTSQFGLYLNSGYSKEEILANNVPYGTLTGNVVTFPAEGMLKAMANYNNGTWYVGNSAEWSITLNLSAPASVANAKVNVAKTLKDNAKKADVLSMPNKGAQFVSVARGKVFQGNKTDELSSLKLR